MERERGLLFLFSCVLFLCGSVVPSRGGSCQRVGIFNEVCPHVVLPATGPRASASLPCLALRLLGLHGSLPESASSEGVPLPLPLGGRGEAARLGIDRCAIPRPSSGAGELSSRGKESKAQGDVERGKKDSEASRNQRIRKKRKRKGVSEEAGRGERRPGKVRRRKAEMRPGLPGCTSSTRLGHQAEVESPDSVTGPERNLNPEPCWCWDH